MAVAFYIQDDWEINDKLKVNYGLRWSGFTQIGPYRRFTRDIDGNKKLTFESGIQFAVDSVTVNDVALIVVELLETEMLAKEERILCRYM